MPAEDGFKIPGVCAMLAGPPRPILIVPAELSVTEIAAVLLSVIVTLSIVISLLLFLMTMPLPPVSERMFGTVVATMHRGSPAM